MRFCRHCGARVGGRISSADFCSDACKQRAYRRRQQGVREDAPPLSTGAFADGSCLADFYGEMPLQRYGDSGSRKQDDVTAIAVTSSVMEGDTCPVAVCDLPLKPCPIAPSRKMLWCAVGHIYDPLSDPVAVE